MKELKHQDKFQEEEEKGRRKLESFLNQSKSASNWQPTTGRYDTVDGFFNYGDKKVVVEIKTRNVKYRNYPTHIMELDKYMNLVKVKAYSNSDKALYTCFFDDALYVYDLKDVNIHNCKVVDRYLPCTSAADTGYRWKRCFEIPTKYAQVYVIDNGKWNKQPAN